MDVADDRVSSDWGVSLATWSVAAFRAKEDRPLVRQQVRPRRRSGPGFPAQDDPGVAQPPGFPPIRFVDCPAFGDLSPAQCRSVRQIDNISGTAGAPGRARVVVGLFCEGTLPSGSAAGP